MDPQIEILFKEYDALRTEIIARTGNIYQLAAIFAALVAGLLTWYRAHLFDWIFIVLAVVMFICSVVLYAGRSKARSRLQQVEKDINDIAKVDLLKWEQMRRQRSLLRIIWRTIFRRHSK
jgi:MFS family permease